MAREEGGLASPCVVVCLLLRREDGDGRPGDLLEEVGGLLPADVAGHDPLEDHHPRANRFRDVHALDAIRGTRRSPSLSRTRTTSAVPTNGTHAWDGIDLGARWIPWLRGRKE